MDPVRKIISVFTKENLPEHVREMFRQWITDPENSRAKEQALYEEWESMASGDVRDVYSISERRRRLAKLHELMKSRPGASRRKGIFVRWYTLAACILAVVSLFSVYVSISGKLNESTVCLVSSDDYKGNFSLPDGTCVWLNSGSRLEYGKDFMKDRVRTVRLTGEGHFDVTESDRPFVVEMGEIKIRVLGTSFNARHSSGFPEDQVTLTRGSIRIDCRGENIIMTPGQQCTFNPDSGTLTIREVDVANYNSWIGNSITFDNMPLYDIVTNLEHWYNVRMEFGPEVDTSVRLSFKLRPETMEETLSLLGHLTGYRYEIMDGNTVMITE